MPKQIHHKKNELFEVQFYTDEECTEVFDFMNAENLYSVLKDGDVTPFLEIYKYTDFRKLFIPYIPNIDSLDFLPTFENIFTLDDITPNLSKYIPEDNAVLFLSEEDCNQYGQDNFEWVLYDYAIKRTNYDFCKKVTIFLPHGTQSKLQKANEVARELREKYGVKEVNLFVLHCFVDDIYNYNSSFLDGFYKQNYNDAYNELCGVECKLDMTKNEYKKQFEIEKKNHKRECYINKIITTNSTGILKPEDSNERLQVIDCKEIFEEYLKENN